MQSQQYLTFWSLKVIWVFFVSTVREVQVLSQVMLFNVYCNNHKKYMIHFLGKMQSVWACRSRWFIYWQLICRADIVDADGCVPSMSVSTGESLHHHSLHVRFRAVCSSDPFTHKLHFYTTFPHFVRKIALIVCVHVCVCVCVCVCVRARARTQICPCMPAWTATPLPPHRQFEATDISEELLCGHWLYASEGRLLFGLHFPSWIIQHGGPVNFWCGHDNEHHICGVLDIMSDGRILRNFYLMLRWCFW